MGLLSGISATLLSDISATLREERLRKKRMR